MHGPINVKSPNNTSKWQMRFNLAFKGLILVFYSVNITMCVTELQYYFFFTLHFDIIMSQSDYTNSLYQLKLLYAVRICVLSLKTVFSIVYNKRFKNVTMVVTIMMT